MLKRVYKASLPALLVGLHENKSGWPAQYWLEDKGNVLRAVLGFCQALTWLYCMQCNLQRQDEVQGEVHEGFYTALFWHSKKSQGAKFIVTKHGMFRRICEALWEVIGTEKSLYVTGHSLGKPRARVPWSGIWDAQVMHAV